MVCINFFLNSRINAIRKGELNREREPFGVRLKDFWDISQSGSLLSEKFTKSLLHKPDGLIFQPSKEVCLDFIQVILFVIRVNVKMLRNQTKIEKCINKYCDNCFSLTRNSRFEEKYENSNFCLKNLLRTYRL